MKISKKLGIYMDHANARLIEFPIDSAKTQDLKSKFTHVEKQLSLSKSENVMHNKEQHEQAEYYKKLGEAIRNFDEVLLFGPTDAKTELLNILKADHLFEKIKIEVKQTDKMSETQEQIFIKEYFSK